MEETIIFNNTEFKQIKDFPNYFISKCGKVLSTKNRKKIILKTGITKDGYLYVNLCKNKKVKLYTIHRLVAETFIINQENKSQVNHKNGIKTNNNVKNLEWCTQSENTKHSFRILKRKPTRYWKNKTGKLHHTSIKIKQIDKNTNNLIKVWDSMMDVKRELGIHNSNISDVCRNKQKTAGGFTWEYL